MNMYMSSIGPVFIYDNVEELIYNFLNCMGLSVKLDGTVVDTELNVNGGTIIKLSGKSLKANTNPNNINIALFAIELSIIHPVTKERLTFTLDIPNRYPFNIF